VGILSRILNLVGLSFTNLGAKYHARRVGYYLYATYKGAKIYTTQSKYIQHHAFDTVDCLAYTVGEYIFVRSPTFVNKQIVSHEYTHVEQWRRYGCFFAIWNYTLELSKKGYYSNKFEVAARAAEKHRFSRKFLVKH
jgi:hypothetical protein